MATPVAATITNITQTWKYPNLVRFLGNKSRLFQIPMFTQNFQMLEGRKSIEILNHTSFGGTDTKASGAALPDAARLQATTSTATYSVIDLHGTIEIDDFDKSGAIVQNYTQQAIRNRLGGFIQNYTNRFFNTATGSFQGLIALTPSSNEFYGATPAGVDTNGGPITLDLFDEAADSLDMMRRGADIGQIVCFMPSRTYRSFISLLRSSPLATPASEVLMMPGLTDHTAVVYRGVVVMRDDNLPINGTRGSLSGTAATSVFVGFDNGSKEQGVGGLFLPTSHMGEKEELGFGITLTPVGARFTDNNEGVRISWYCGSYVANAASCLATIAGISN